MHAWETRIGKINVKPWLCYQRLLCIMLLVCKGRTNAIVDKTCLLHTMNACLPIHARTTPPSTRMAGKVGRGSALKVG